MNIFISIIIFIIISFLGGFVRLCIFGSCSIKEAFIFILICDIAIGILFAIFEMFSIREETTRDTIFLITIVPLALIFTVMEFINSNKKRKEGHKD